jgi:hypothetical protein
MTRELHKGTVVAMHREPVTGTSFIEIDDDDKGKVLVPCLGTPTARRLDDLFGGVIVDGKFNKHGIAGKRIAYRLGEDDILMVDSIKIPRERKVPPSGKGRTIDLGFLPPEDKVYSRGPIVAGRAILKPEDDEMVKVTVGGSLPPDHPIFSRGPVIFGRNLPPAPK